MHTLDDTGAGESFNNASGASSQDESFQGNNQSLLIQPPLFATPESQKEQQDFLSFHNQLLLSQQNQSMTVTNSSFQRQVSIPGIGPAKHTQPDPLAMIGLAKQTLPLPNNMSVFAQRQASQSSHEQSPPPIGMPMEGHFNGVTSIYDFPGMPVSSSLTMADDSIVGSSENSKRNRCSGKIYKSAIFFLNDSIVFWIILFG